MLFWKGQKPISTMQATLTDKISENLVTQRFYLNPLLEPPALKQLDNKQSANSFLVFSAGSAIIAYANGALISGSRS